MSSPPSKLALLQHVVKNLHLETWKQGPITQSQLQALQLVRGKMGPAGIAGVRVEAAEALSLLADAIFSGPPYQRGTSFEAVLNKLTDILITNYMDKANTTLEAKDVAFVEHKIAEWFQEQIAVYEFYIPCFISPWDAAPFWVGPVQFRHIREFAPAAQAETDVMFDLTFGPVFELMARSAANWMATVKVEGSTKERAQEIANLAVDIALAALQLCIPEDGAQHMARMTGRSMPVFSQAVSRSDGQLSTGTTNSEPGRAFGPGFLDQRLAQAKPVLDSIGSRVAAFICGNGRLSELEQAWPDAAYWFHEGLAEPLDTIAVPKLETAIEILLRSESTKGSKARVVKAIQAFYGKKPHDFINPDSQTTVEQFAQGFVRDRSRILHGTWSTLTHSLRASRPSLTTLVRTLLAMYSLELDHYATSPSPSDEVEAFLNFVQARQNESTVATAPPVAATAAPPGG
jgi:hypothetical protein